MSAHLKASPAHQTLRENKHSLKFSLSKQTLEKLRLLKNTAKELWQMGTDLDF